MSGFDAEGFAGDACGVCLRQPRVAAGEAYVKHSRYRRWVRSPGEIARTEVAERGFAVRAFRADGRAGHAFSAELDDRKALEAAAGWAAKMAERAAPGNPLPPGAWAAPDLDLFDPAVESVPAVEGLLERLEAAVREEGRGEVRVESLGCIAGASTVTLATTAGFLASYRSTLLTVVLSMRASRGTGAHLDRSFLAARHLASLDVDRLGREAARRARMPLDGGSVPPGPVRVALEPRVACTLVDHLAGSLLEGAAARGTSALPSGAEVATEAVSLVDDPSMGRGLASMPFDGEGRPTGARRVIDRGRTGALLGATGDGGRVGAAQRTSFADPPRIGPSNLHVVRGARGQRPILAEAGRVLRVSGASLLGRGGPASGEIVLAASGEWLQDGEPAGGVRGVTLVGRLGEILRGVLEVGNDLSFHLRRSCVGSPTILLDGMWAA